VPDQAVAVEVLGQDVDAHWRQADSCVAGETEPPADDVGGGAGLGHYAHHLA
jgi:hypothetical protein